MEHKIPNIPCPTNFDCVQRFQDVHHIRPRRLIGEAKDEGRSPEYQAKLKKVVEHPMNKIISCRCIHKLGLDMTPVGGLPVEPELDNLLNRWNPDVGQQP